jgi:hypothetical protein
MGLFTDDLIQVNERIDKMRELKRRMEAVVKRGTKERADNTKIQLQGVDKCIAIMEGTYE